MDSETIKLNNKRLFDEEAHKYASNEYWRPEEDYLVKKYFTGPKMLVIGCGAGRVISYLLEMGAFDITAIDISPEMVKISKDKFPGLPISVMDANDLKFPDNTFDSVFFPFNGIDYNDDVYRIVREVRRVMRDDGVFVFSSHNRFFLKKIYKSYEKYSNYHGHITYKTSFCDYFRLRLVFKEVTMFGRAEILAPWKDLNWKDKIFRILPFLDKYTYFVCRGK